MDKLKIAFPDFWEHLYKENIFLIISGQSSLNGKFGNDICSNNSAIITIETPLFGYLPSILMPLFFE